MILSTDNKTWEFADNGNHSPFCFPKKYELKIAEFRAAIEHELKNSFHKLRELYDRMCET